MSAYPYRAAVTTQRWFPVDKVVKDMIILLFLKRVRIPLILDNLVPYRYHKSSPPPTEAGVRGVLYEHLYLRHYGVSVLARDVRTTAHPDDTDRTPIGIYNLLCKMFRKIIKYVLFVDSIQCSVVVFACFSLHRF